MWQNVNNQMKLARRRAMTLPEILIACAVALYTIAGTSATYMMVSKWWREIEPRISAQRVARTALMRIVDGIPDATTGTITIGNKTYNRRNGIKWATQVPDISADTKTISYCLEADNQNQNRRRFYLGVDASTGLNAVYYRDGDSADRIIRSTIGITDMKFETVAGNNNIIKVTATVEKDVAGTRSQGLYHVEVAYSDVIHLRNAPL